MAQTVLKVEGLAEFRRDIRRIDRDLAKEIPKGLRRGADIVAQDARSRLTERYRGTTPGSLRPRARGLVAYVESRSSKRKRGDFGALIMQNILLPAAESKEDDVYRLIDGELAVLFGRFGF